MSADGAYDSKACHEAIAREQAAAIISMRRSAKSWTDAREVAQARNAILRATRKLGREVERLGVEIGAYDVLLDLHSGLCVVPFVLRNRCASKNTHQHGAQCRAETI